MSPPDISPQESRENADPQEGSRPIPAWLLVTTVLLVISCVYYIVRSDAAAASAYGDSRTLSDLAQKPKSAASAGATADFQMVPNTTTGTAAGTMICTSAKSP